VLHVPRPATRVFCLGVLLLSTPSAAGQPEPPGTISEVALPGGLRAALATIADRTTPDRAQFLLEFIRRTHDTIIDTRDTNRGGSFRALLAHLDRHAGSSEPAASDTLPLPLTIPMWTDVVFRGAATPQTLVAEILRSRNASLLYAGLLSLDDETRAWLAGEPELVSDLATRHPAAFLLAAPGIRVAGGIAQGPGGDAARPIWEALAGRPSTEPVAFVRGLLAERDGRLAYFAGAMAQLTPPQRRATLQLDSPAAADRIAAARRLLTLFERVAPGWKVADRAFWRPALDPALLIADLGSGPDGRPVIPGTRHFWNAVLAPGDSPLPAASLDSGAGDGPVDVVWLCERVFEEPVDHRRRYQIAMFAARLLGGVTTPTTRETVDAVRASVMYPALVTALERARVTNATAIAAAAARAGQIVEMSGDAVAVRTLAQFQGLLAVLTRAGIRGSLSPPELSAAISAVSAIEPGPRGEYDGRIVRWFADWTRARRARRAASIAQRGGPSAGLEDEHDGEGPTLERDVLRLLAGTTLTKTPRTVEWEGTRYRVDLSAGELARLSRFLGEHPRPYLTAAEQFASSADALSKTPLSPESIQRQKAEIGSAAQLVGLTDEQAWLDDVLPGRYRELTDQLQRLAATNASTTSARVVGALRTLADDLAARGLTEIVYAVAMGDPESLPISIEDAASRHDFGMTSPGTRRRTAWQLPVAGADSRRGWHVTGSLLGLDARLAEFSLRRLSNRPPARRPTLNDEDRRVLIETAVIFDSGVLHAEEADLILTGIRRGRARLEAVRSPADAAAIADAVPLSAARRTLLMWSAAHEPSRLLASLSPLELLWAGLDPATPAPRLHAWGVSAESRLGCLCPQMIDRRPWESVAGRWTWGMMASVFPDLNLRLVELLADLGMPAVLLGPVLASATLDFVNGAPSRDPDDRRGMVEFVQAITPQRVEDYLALLTTDGPLVPIEQITPASARLEPPAPGGRP
jgi:hypothetical protein